MENQAYAENDKPFTPFMNKAVGRNALIFGVGTGVVLILFSLVLYVFDQTSNKAMGYISFLLMIAGIVYGIWHYKRENLGFLTIGKGVASGTLIALYAGLISSIFSVLLMQYIDPELFTQALAQAEEQMLSRNPNMSDAELDMAIGFAEKMMKPIPMALMSTLWFVLIGLIVSLVASAIMKKDPETVS